MVGSLWPGTVARAGFECTMAEERLVRSGTGAVARRRLLGLYPRLPSRPRGFAPEALTSPDVNPFRPKTEHGDHVALRRLAFECVLPAS